MSFIGSYARFHISKGHGKYNLHNYKLNMCFNKYNELCSLSVCASKWQVEFFKKQPNVVKIYLL